MSHTKFQRSVIKHVEINHKHLRARVVYTPDVITILPRLKDALSYAVVEMTITRLFHYEDDTDHNSQGEDLLSHSDPQYIQKLDKHLNKPPYHYTEIIHQDNYLRTIAHLHDSTTDNSSTLSQE